MVLLVIRSVKLVTLPTTSPAKLCMPVTIDAANSPPGRLGIEGAERPVLGVVVEGVGREATGLLVVLVLRPQVGS